MKIRTNVLWGGGGYKVVNKQLLRTRFVKNALAVFICIIFFLSVGFGMLYTTSQLRDSKTATGTIKFDIVDMRSLTFNNATWEQVQYVAEHYGQAGMPTWSVGDTKQIRIYDTAEYATAGNETYSRLHTVRIADIRSGRYTISGGATNGQGKSSGTTNFVIELAEPMKLVSTDTNGLGIWQTQMNPTNTNTNGWMSADLQNKLNSISGDGILGRLQTDLQAVIPKVKVHSNIGNCQKVEVKASNYVNNRLFLPAACNVMEIGSDWSSDAQEVRIYQSEEYNFYTQGKSPTELMYQYYVENTNEIRKKTHINKENGNDLKVTPQWWLRTPYVTTTSSENGIFLYVDSTGIVQAYYASYNYTVSFCWAM